MTTGSSSFNTMHWESGLSIPGTIGVSASTSWSGADRARAPLAPSSRVKRNKGWVYGGPEPFLKREAASGFSPPRSLEEHPYQKTWTRSRSDPIVLYNDYNGDGIWDLEWDAAPPQANVWFTKTMSAGWTGNDDAKLVSKLLLQIKGSDFHLGNFLGEFNQTLGLIGGTAQAVYEAGKAAKRGNFQRAFAKLAEHRRTRGHLIQSNWNEVWRQRALTASSNHLKFVYGVLPLLQDVEGAAEYLAHQLNIPRRQIYKASRRIGHVNDPNAFVNPSRPPGAWYSYTPDSSGICYQKQIKLIVEEVDPFQLSGLTDVASTAWELTPFSFVFDWFLPIGNWLQARGMASAVKGIYVTSTKDWWYWKGAKSANAHALILNAKNIGMSGGTMTRTVGTSPDLPLPSFKPFAKAASWQHCLNAVSLVTSIALGRSS